ncbi:hypothetical protein BU23DRAFT_564798 [Bimuria novae-zelandiae CBS 107.79]|uniref:Uncharacterized protein n=1 Tax=Bimuria novae-zelandiae CBS 107.79 TaxID=1447943 RepID=A0A6A5VM56_9PLEO|nr:hypothetical protein BU23DRAFT_564798 [Bimuria novae-zelandiae CBS 107.79]
MPATLATAWSSLAAAILQLQTSIQAYQTSQQPTPHSKNISKNIEIDPTLDATNNTKNAQEHSVATQTDEPIPQNTLTTLSAQLSTFETQLKQRNQWQTPPHFYPDPSLPLDLSDLDEAITLLARALDSPAPTLRHPQLFPTPRPAFSQQKWTWDFHWAEFYYVHPQTGNHVYLSEWVRRDLEDELEWEIISQGDRSVEEGLAVLGAWEEWEEWEWDGEWGEWFLPLGERGAVERRVYASEWERGVSEVWIHVERSGLGAGDEEGA